MPGDLWTKIAQKIRTVFFGRFRLAENLGDYFLKRSSSDYICENCSGVASPQQRVSNPITGSGCNNETKNRIVVYFTDRYQNKTRRIQQDGCEKMKQRHMAEQRLQPPINVQAEHDRHPNFTPDSTRVKVNWVRSNGLNSKKTNTHPSIHYLQMSRDICRMIDYKN